MTNLPIIVRNELEKFNIESKQEFRSEYDRRTKSKLVAYVLWFIGFHYIYLGKYIIQILFLITSGGFGIWWLIDFIRVWGMIDNYNNDIAISTMRDIKIITS